MSPGLEIILKPRNSPPLPSSVRKLGHKARDFEALKLLGQQPPAPTPPLASDTETDPYATAQIVAVSRVRQGREVYLVDKATGSVFDHNLEAPTVIGRWSEQTGVVLHSADHDIDR